MNLQIEEINKMTTGEAAQFYREKLGWNAIPLCPPDHIGVGKRHGYSCHSWGKRPLDDWKAFQKEKCSDYYISDTFKQHPNANVGVVLGSTSGQLVAVDVDGVAAKKVLLDLIGVRHGFNLPTLAFRTHRGFRLLYSLPASLGAVWSNRKAVVEDGELAAMGQGQQTVMPPSRHKEGSLYQWHLKPGAVLQEAPEWLLRWRPPSAAKDVAKKYDRTAQDFSEKAESEAITASRNNYLFRIASAMRRYGCTVEEIEHALLKVNLRCEPQLELSEIQNTILRTVRGYLPKDKKEAS